MARKTPAEQIQAAKEALARAQRRQRAHDTRAKIVLGGFVLAWARADQQTARMLLQRLNSEPPREQDREALAEVRNELMQMVRSSNGADTNDNG